MELLSGPAPREEAERARYIEYLRSCAQQHRAPADEVIEMHLLRVAAPLGVGPGWDEELKQLMIEEHRAAVMWGFAAGQGSSGSPPHRSGNTGRRRRRKERSSPGHAPGPRKAASDGGATPRDDQPSTSEGHAREAAPLSARAQRRRPSFDEVKQEFKHVIEREKKAKSRQELGRMLNENRAKVARRRASTEAALAVLAPTGPLDGGGEKADGDAPAPVRGPRWRRASEMAKAASRVAATLVFANPAPRKAVSEGEPSPREVEPGSFANRSFKRSTRRAAGGDAPTSARGQERRASLIEDIERAKKAKSRQELGKMLDENRAKAARRRASTEAALAVLAPTGPLEGGDGAAHPPKLGPRGRRRESARAAMQAVDSDAPARTQSRAGVGRRSTVAY